MPEETLKTCITCKHYDKNNVNAYMIEHRCGKFARPNPVTGVGFVDYVKCSEARSHGHCQYEGIKWESKDAWEE